jgi:hypothetical protein
MLMGCLIATKLNDNYIPIYINIFGPLFFCQAETIFMRSELMKLESFFSSIPSFSACRRSRCAGVFSATYLRGSLAPSSFPSALRQAQGSGLRFPPLISRENNGGLPPVTAKRPQSHALSISAALYCIQGESLPAFSVGACPLCCRRGMGLFERMHLSAPCALCLTPYTAI